MTSFSYKQLRASAQDSLNAVGKIAGKLVLIHVGVNLGLSLLLTVIHYLLDAGIAQTGGLGGIGARALLETAQNLLTYVQMIALPFWEMGYVFVVLRMARRQDVMPSDLMTGFRCFGPVLRGKILCGLIYVALMIVGAQVSSTLFLLTPAAKDMIAYSAQLVEAEPLDYAALLSDEAHISAMLPALPFMAAGMLLPVIPLFYRLRMMDYILMDEPRRGALYALISSIRMTRKKGLALFKLDLQFWWYYLLQLLTMALLYGDTLLPMMGVALPMGAEAAWYLFYALALVAELALYLWRKNQVSVTYALVYQQLLEEELAQPAPQPNPQPAPQNVPWNY